MAKYKTCPSCDSVSIGRRWESSTDESRRMIEYCAVCDWNSEPFVPAKKRIKGSKEYTTWGSAWHYELFDGNGYTMTLSQSFGSRDQCVTMLKKELAHFRKLHRNGVTRYGRCVGIVYPPSVTVKGERFR